MHSNKIQRAQAYTKTRTSLVIQILIPSEEGLHEGTTVASVVHNVVLPVVLVEPNLVHDAASRVVIRSEFFPHRRLYSHLQDELQLKQYGA